MRNLLKHLRTNKKSTTNIEDVLLNNFEGLQLDLFRSEPDKSKRNKTQRRYTKEIKKFALTLHFYSPRAYEFVQSKLFLSHSRMIRKWLCTVNCEIRFLSEVFEFLKVHVIGNNDDLKNVALIFNAMAIRKAITYDKKNSLTLRLCTIHKQ